MSPSDVHILTPSHPQCADIINSIVHLHASCILNDYTMASFIPPLSYEKMHRRWLDHLNETTTGQRIILVFVSKITERSTKLRPEIEFPFDAKAWPSLSSSQEKVAGVISLSMPISETGPFRGIVQNLFVSPFHRRKRVATKLLDELERRALEAGRWNLMLDTIEGTDAESLYEKLKWERLGVIRDYGINPLDGRLQNEVFFWRDIRGNADRESKS